MNEKKEKETSKQPAVVLSGADQNLKGLVFYELERIKREQINQVTKISTAVYGD